MSDLPEQSARTLVFNTPLEAGLRAIVLLTVCFPRGLSLDELVALDHFIVHTEDFGGPQSLHPAEKTRAAELLVRRDLISAGLRLIGLKGLVTQHAEQGGFRYRAGAEAGNFVDLLSSAYSRRLVECAQWLSENVLNLPQEDFDALITKRLDSILLPENMEEEA